MNRVPTVGTPCIGIVSCEFYKDNWEEQTGRKRKRKSKTGINNDTSSSITNDTRNHQTPITPSIIHATHQIDPNYYIQNGTILLYEEVELKFFYRS